MRLECVGYAAGGPGERVGSAHFWGVIGDSGWGTWIMDQGDE